MKTKAIGSFFVLFAIAAVMVSSTPAAFADHPDVTIVTSDDSGFNLECGTDCYMPSALTVHVGQVVTFSNPVGFHTYTAGTWPANSAPAPSGEFDVTLKEGESATWTPETAGEIPYYCALHMWMTGTIIVEAEAAEEEAIMEEEVMVEIATGTAEAGEMLSIDVTFTTMSGDSVEHVNYDITATQNGEVVLNDMGVHDHDGVMNHMTSALSEAASDDAPVQVEVMFNGFGIDPPFTGPVGQVSEKQVVPEFGTIAMMVLAVAIISIVAVTAKSRVVPRF